MANSKRRCRGCKEYFDRSEMLSLPGGWFHSIDCAKDYGLDRSRKAAEKKKRSDHRKAKEKLKTRSDWLRECQQAFNRYIRARDHGKPCISCGRSTGAKVNAGHYLTVGAHPELRFEPLNCHLQCEHCNCYLSGNLIRYRQKLIEVIGQDMVDWLEGPHEAKKYTIDDLKAIKAKYNALANELIKGHNLISP
jgi:hypothetical protein